MWYVIGLVWLAAMAGIVFAYNRKHRRRSAERAAQMANMLADFKANPQSVLDTAGKSAAAVAAPPVPQFSKKQRLLPQPTALLYYVFRAGLPDHEIFAGLAISDVLDAVPATSGAHSAQQLAGKLAQQRLDLVVCTKQLEIVAAVVASSSAMVRQSDDIQFSTQCLQAAGIRVVTVDPAALPRHHQVHALIYG